MSNARDLADLGKSAEAIDVDASAPADSLNLDASGKVGIGTDSPNGKTEIASSATGNVLALQLSNSAGAGSDSVTLRFRNSTSSTSASGGSEITGLRDTSNNGGSLLLKTASSIGTMTERMRIDSSGNVGIGTSSPTQELEVAGTIRSSLSAADYSIGATTSGGGGFFIEPDDYTAANPTWEIRTYANEPLAFQMGNSERMRIDSAGRVTMPYQPAFVANWNGFSAPSLVPSSAWTNVQVNRGNHFSTSTGRFVAPVGGVYVFFGGFLRNNTNDVLRGDFLVNGTNMGGNGSAQYRTSEGYSGYNLPATHTGMFQLSANDYVEYYVDGSGSVYGPTDDTYNIFGGYLLG